MSMNYLSLRATQFISVKERQQYFAPIKCRWVEEGEKPTNYFFNLQKRNYKKKTIAELHVDEEQTLRENNPILNAIQQFYDNLYTSVGHASQDTFQDFANDLEVPKLSENERSSLEGPLSIRECKEGLELFQTNKSPGEDGFTVEFYKFFFDLVGQHFLLLSWAKCLSLNDGE